MSQQVTSFVLILYILTSTCQSSLPEGVANIPNADECLTNSLETYLQCRGSRAINNIINNLSKTNKSIVIVRGLEIVPANRYKNFTTDDKKKLSREESAGNGETDTDDDDTLFGRFSRYLRTHELNIKFADLLSDDESERRYLARDSELSGIKSNLLDEARKKDKGSGTILALGFMLSKMMAVMGLGGIGALAMKALGIAMTALMMATVVGIKSIAHQGNESSHSVQYVTADSHHHIRRRRRRSAGNKSVFSKYPAILSQGEDVKIKLPLMIYKGWHG